MIDRIERTGRALAALPVRWAATGLFALVALPLVVALGALSRRRWYPVLDMAMTELRVRDVGTADTPLIGLPGRIGELPDVGSHPGPLSFWVLSPTYRLLGERANALEVGTVVVQLAVIAVCLWCGYRLAGRLGMLAIAVLAAVVVRGYGMELLTTPWNPYFPLLAWVLVMLSTTAVLAGHARWLIVLVVAGSFAAQTHVPYLLPSIAMFCLAAGALIWSAVRAPRSAEDGGMASLTIAVGVGFVLWLPALIDELTRRPGNITQLREHFATPSEDTLGLGEGLSILLRHLNVVDAFGRSATSSGRFVDVGLDLESATWPGAIVALLWLAGAAFAVVAGSRLLRALHAVVALGAVVAIVSISRIFGMPWYYLTLWVWAVGAVMLVAIVATAVAAVRHHWPDSTAGKQARPVAATAAGAILVWATFTTTVDAAGTDHIEEYLGEPLAELVPDTREAMRAGVGAADGPDGVYRVRWADALYIHSQAYGLLSELDRDGFEVKVDSFFAVPATEHRALGEDEASDITATIQFANGPYVDEIRGRPDAVEVATYDPRTEPGDDERFAAARQRILDEIDAREADGTFDAERGDELRNAVDYNLFLIAEELHLSTAAHASAAVMGDIGVETAVFILPAEG